MSEDKGPADDLLKEEIEEFLQVFAQRISEVEEKLKYASCDWHAKEAAEEAAELMRVMMEILDEK